MVLRTANYIVVIVTAFILLCAINAGQVFAEQVLSNIPELDRRAKQKIFNKKQHFKQQKWCRANPKKCRKLEAQRRAQRAKATRLCAENPKDCEQNEQQLEERKKRLFDYIDRHQKYPQVVAD